MFKKKLLQIVHDKLFLPTALYVVMDLILLSFIVYLSFTIYDKYQEVVTIETEIVDLKLSADLVRGNKDLVQENIEQYNELLDALIPSEETYFQIIAALDQLENETGAVIQSYSIDLQETTEKKLSLALTVGGDEKSIQNLLERYVYGSGRLMTNQSVSLSFTELSTFSFDINLIHLPKADFILPEVVILQEEDILLLNQIEKEI
ncbi:MAG: hypothetical protein O3B87_03785 [bacterium]|nr:hypothetical protein [bacterium]